MRQASHRHSHQHLTLQPQTDGVGEVVQTREEANKSLSHVAVEVAHAVRHALTGDRLPAQAGYVQRESHQHNGLESRYSQGSDPDFPSQTEDARGDVTFSDSQPRLHTESDANDAIIRAEAASVKAKFTVLDASTDVVLRFDFMNEHDTKVNT